MLYCKHCSVLCPGEECPDCGSGDLFEPAVNDPVYLHTWDFLTAGGVEGVLEQHGIPFLKKGVQGAWLTTYVGLAMEGYRIYVPFGAFDKSMELLSGFFGEAEVIE